MSQKIGPPTSNEAASRLRSLNLHSLRGTDAWQLLQMRALASEQQPFFDWHPYAGPSRQWTYGDVVREAAAVGAGLHRRGVRPGQSVLIHLENCPEFIVAWFACAAIGAVAVTTNARSAGNELAYFADNSGAVAAITQPRFASVVSESARGIRWQAVIDHDAGEPTRQDAGADAFHLLYSDPNDLPERAIDPMAPMCVQYTSGTTARPKGVVWTHANAVWGARQNALHVDLHPNDCQLVYMPLFHTNALSYSMLASIWVGSRFILLPKWSSSRFWALSLRYGCTFLSASGLAHRAIMSQDVPDEHSYQRAGFGFCEAFESKLAVKTIGWFGMTETISHPIIGNPFGRDRPMAMGRPAPEYGVAVVDDDGVMVAHEETGELRVLGIPGVSLFAGYLNEPTATADAFDDLGWFRTGDLVKAHADGYLSYSSRSKDLLRVGSENVAAPEIERVILGTGRVSEAAVVGRDDEKLDQVPVAFVIPRGSADGLADHVIAECAAKLAAFKVPRAVYVVQELPRSTLFKVNKGELQRVVTDGSSLDSVEQRWVNEARLDPSGDSMQSD
jgi:crotonobetaine/carnitine-CoA ligase